MQESFRVFGRAGALGCLCGAGRVRLPGEFWLLVGAEPGADVAAVSLELLKTGDDVGNNAASARPKRTVLVERGDPVVWSLRRSTCPDLPVVRSSN